MNISETQIQEIIKKVVQNLNTSTTTLSKVSTEGNWGVFSKMNDAVEAAHEAYLLYKDRSVQCRKKITDAVRQMALDHKEEFAKRIFLTLRCEYFFRDIYPFNES